MAEKKPWRLSDVTLKDVRKTRYTAAVLPFGATEPHNLHLPYSTDNIEVAAVCDRACAWAWKRGAKIALLDHIPFGADQNMLAFPMAVNLDQEILNSIVASVARSLERHGVFKLVVVNGHGGNDFKSGLRTLFGRTPVFCCLLNWYQMMGPDGAAIFENPGEHADEMETSMIQALAPHLVNLKDADDGGTYPSRFEAVRAGWAWHPRRWERLTKNSGHGDPRQARPEKGERLMKLVEERMGKFLLELARSKMDKSFPFDQSKPAKPARH
jgi:creatinine amidohydrolase